MPDLLPAPKKILRLNGHGRVDADGRSRQEKSDRDIRLLPIIGLMLLLAAVAFYKLAGLIASTCWACG